MVNREHGTALSREVAIYRLKLGARVLQEQVSMVGRRVRSAQRALPDLVIIGGQKCGSTSLFAYLARHSRMVPSTAKEVHFFDVNFRRGVNWYRAHFPFERDLQDGKRLAFEASPYYLYHPRAPQRAAAVVPNAKLIAILRNPVARAYSHYWHERKRGYERLPLREAFAAEERRLELGERRLAANPFRESYEHRHFSYLARGRYAEQLRRWLDYYPRQQLLVLEAEELFHRPAEQMKRVTSFLGIEDFGDGQFDAKNVGRYSAIPADLRLDLEEYYLSHNADLVSNFGRDFSWARQMKT